MYSLSAAVVPRALRAVWRGSGSSGLTPVHHGSQALAPGLIHEVSCKRLGVARLAINSEPASAAGVRPNINTRQGLRRGVVDTTSPFPSDRPSSVTFTDVVPVPVIDMPAQSSKSDSATAT